VFFTALILKHDGVKENDEMWQSWNFLFIEEKRTSEV